MARVSNTYVAAARKLGVVPLAAKGVLKTFAVFEIVQVSPELIQEAVDCSIGAAVDRCYSIWLQYIDKKWHRSVVRLRCVRCVC